MMMVKVSCRRTLRTSLGMRWLIQRRPQRPCVSA